MWLGGKMCFKPDRTDRLPKQSDIPNEKRGSKTNKNRGGEMWLRGKMCFKNARTDRLPEQGDIPNTTPPASALIGLKKNRMMIQPKPCNAEK